MRCAIAGLVLLAACSIPATESGELPLDAIRECLRSECEDQGLSCMAVAIAMPGAPGMDVIEVAWGETRTADGVTRDPRGLKWVADTGGRHPLPGPVGLLASGVHPSNRERMVVGSRWSYGLPAKRVAPRMLADTDIHADDPSGSPALADLARRTAYGSRFRDDDEGNALGTTWFVMSLPWCNGGLAIATDLFPARAALERVAHRVTAILRGDDPESGSPRLVPVSPERIASLLGRYSSGDAMVEVLEIAGEPWLVPHEGPWLHVRMEAATGALRVRDRLHVDVAIAVQGDELEFDGATYAKLEGPPSPCPDELRATLGEYSMKVPFERDFLALERHGRLRQLDAGLVERSVESFWTQHSVGYRLVPAASGTFRITPRHPPEELRRLAEAATPPSPPPDALPFDLVELRELDPTIRYDIRYASDDNFMGFALYTEASALLQRPAAEAVVRAHRALAAQGYGIVVHDAWRPWLVTKMFWDATPEHQHTFVADPSKGSRHNRGCAIDVSLFELASGAIVEMPSGYDEFTERAYPFWPGGTGRSRALRDLLRRTMEHEGFTVYEAEWWHFDFAGWQRYPVR